jgi:nucleoside-triphosphatase
MEMKAVFVTGASGVGKSSLVQEIVKRLGVRVGGISTPEIRKDGQRIGFELIDLAGGARGVLASVDIKSKPRISKYGVNIKDIEHIAIPALEAALTDRTIKLVVIDELGRMELCSKKFQDVVKKVLDSRKPKLIVLHRSYVNKFKHAGEIFVLTNENREEIKERILKMVREFLN